MLDQSTRIVLTCPQCGKLFETYTCWARRARPVRFCSAACGYAARTTPIEDRFWIRVCKSSDPDGCWVWTAGKGSFGYGSITARIRGVRRSWPAHRISYELTYGLIPDGLWVLHRCDNPPCVRPDHLFLGTASDNALDRTRKGRTAHGDTSGARTHPESIPRRVMAFHQTKPHRVRHGEQVRSSKLVASQILSIRRLYATGTISQDELGRRFGVSQLTISHIVRRKTWAHI